MKIRVLIADDDSLIRESLKIILGMDDNIEIVDTVDNGLKAVEMCAKNLIDIALLDIRMPILNGVEAAKKIAENTNCKPLILTTFDEDDYIKDALKNGAKGYILKNNSPEKIINAIKTVYSGNTVMQDEILDKIKEGLNYKKNYIDESIFTERELDIIKAIAEGLSNKEISCKLFISEGTVKNYITNILSKTNLKHRTQIAIYYLKGEA
ncbi:oxygen regulatory protein NreC [Clostridium homopropionicum DSM 5847]|uniref:Stage 0 sporulation protein A homolog n=1 Tax=Clostridium homopropionicum DSM 5847 TaxID=1121318 RepID=A0A0L6Z5H0_9CLOT|nr:response regulator transcription factor [Clostridium homopropionicum]KOA18202.1 oxygen regulatory protein NreC [Clostridium homopropionicum DSM 5847]SFF71359.1 two component transcriptional regulator, LuxR family [Clostridium homopropionicum]